MTIYVIERQKRLYDSCVTGVVAIESITFYLLAIVQQRLYFHSVHSVVRDAKVVVIV